MKNTKQFFAVFLSVIVCVLVISAITYATTTISTDIVTGGTVAISGADSSDDIEWDLRGTASISDDLIASGTFQFGAGEGTATVAYSRLGSGTTGHSLADADDLLITGLLEVNDIVYFDNAASVSGDFSVDGIASISSLVVDGTASVSDGFILGSGGATITSGTASPSGNCTDGSIYLRSGMASMGLAFNVCTGANIWTSLASESDAVDF